MSGPARRAIVAAGDHAVNDLQILRESPLFRGLDEADLQRLLEVSAHRKFISGQRLFHKGDPCDGMYFVLSGEVKIGVVSAGQELVFARLKPGEAFGELALLDGQPRSADATGEGDTAVLVVPRDAFLDFLRNRPTAAAQLLAVLSGRLRASDEALRGLATKNANEALAQTRTLGDRVADTVASFGGSWAFIGTFLLTICLWMGLNLVPGKKPFDEYPFQFLNLVLAIVASLQAPIIMMSQNRQSEKDSIQSDLDYQVNLKNELEIKRMHDKLDAMHTAQLSEIRGIRATLDDGTETARKSA